MPGFVSWVYTVSGSSSTTVTLGETGASSRGRMAALKAREPKVIRRRRRRIMVVERYRSGRVFCVEDLYGRTHVLLDL